MTPLLLPRWVTQLLLLFLYCSARLRAYQFLCRIRHDTFSKYYKLLLHLHCRSRYLQCRCHVFFDSFSLHKCTILLLTVADIDWNNFLPVLSGKSPEFLTYAFMKKHPIPLLWSDQRKLYGFEERKQ